MSSKKYKSCILTSYFTLKKHPQCLDTRNEIIGINSDGFVKNNSFQYICNFYNSVVNLDLDVVIFHDNLSDEYIDQYSTNNISFVKVNESKYSNNDYRFLCYLKWLRGHEYESVFLVDIADVIVVKDPSFIEINESICFCKDAFALLEYKYGPISFVEICTYLSLDCSGIKNIENLDLLNMGVIGANYKSILNFLNLFWEYRVRCGYHQENINMSLGNYVARMHFDRIHCGYPFCSEFKKYQTDRKDVYFIHK